MPAQTRRTEAERVPTPKRRVQRIRDGVAAICAALLLLTSAGAHANIDEETSNQTASPLVDLFLLRPLGFFSFGIGAIAFAFPVLPVVLITRPQEIGVPFMMMVGKPAQYVFVDRLGSH